MQAEVHMRACDRRPPLVWPRAILHTNGLVFVDTRLRARARIKDILRRLDKPILLRTGSEHGSIESLETCC